jgi:pheromone shutdown protein TraB
VTLALALPAPRFSNMLAAKITSGHLPACLPPCLPAKCPQALSGTVVPGSHASVFTAALRACAADEVGARVVCGDRDIRVTLTDAGAALRAQLAGVKMTSVLSSLAVATMGGSPALSDLAAALQAEGMPNSTTALMDIAERLKSRRVARAMTEVRMLRQLC